VWMGLLPDRANEGKTQAWQRPREPFEEMGCPGAWARSPFWQSLDRYYRQRDEQGGRIENRALSLTEDPLVIEAIETIEAYEEMAHAEYLRLYYKEQAAKQKARNR